MTKTRMVQVLKCIELAHNDKHMCLASDEPLTDIAMSYGKSIVVTEREIGDVMRMKVSDIFVDF
jgi:hypothetical protein